MKPSHTLPDAKKIAILCFSCGLLLVLALLATALCLAGAIREKTSIFVVLTILLCLVDGLIVFCAAPLLRSVRLLQRAPLLLEGGVDPFEKFKSAFLFETIGAIADSRQRLFTKEQEMALVRKRSEFSALQSQINPHFLYNTLESIRSEALAQNVPQIATMIKTLSSYYRYCIGTYKSVVTFREELKNLGNYFSIQKFRFGDKLALDIKVDEEDAACYDFPMLKMTLQPIAENAIYHGLETKPGQGVLTITAELTQKSFLITLSDNGTGIPPEQLNRINNTLRAPSFDASGPDGDTTGGSGRGGVALVNVNRRIKILFGEEYGLSLRSIPGVGTDVEVSLPITAPLPTEET